MLALLNKRKAQGTIRPAERDSIHTVGIGAFKLINSTLYTTPSNQVLKKVNDDFGSIVSLEILLSLHSQLSIIQVIETRCRNGPVTP